ncbi:MAG: glycine cleavage system protein [Planctomycetota bacterium]|nr:glycine cleavage system protein [Planctomycetota bacterium]
MAAAAPLSTSLHAWHAANRGRLVEFGGWSMPVMYSSIVEEHQAVRNRVGLFDIGHMGRLRFGGPGARDWIEFATTNQVAKLQSGQIQYSLMVDEAGGVLDDILVYRLQDETGFGVVCNASNREKVVGQFQSLQGGRDAEMQDMTLETGMIAVQGPLASQLLTRVIQANLGPLKYYHHCGGEFDGQSISVSRTGYTGEDGLEVIVLADAAEALWTALLVAGNNLGVMPCGLGARDTLRFEAAMPLYGHEMDQTVNPYAAGLGWAVKLNKGEFVGRDALRGFKTDPGKTRVGIALEGKRIARQGSIVSREGRAVGVVTSGTFSPTLAKSLAMALVEPSSAAESTALTIDIRGNTEPARIVPLPFYRRPAAS